MKTIQKTQDGTYLLNTDNTSIRTMFNDWKIWLTKKELSDIYWVKKWNIKKELNWTEPFLVESLKKRF